MLVNPKYDAFIDCKADVEFLEGTTASGKTTVGVYKFLLEVAENKQQQHIIAGLDNGTIEKNIINADHGIIDEWGVLVEYHGNGTAREKLPHILFHAPDGDKTIYVMGYADKARWKKALGGQYGCLYIDEINIADMEFVRESAMRCDYLIATLNPDDPDLPIYSEYINHARPLEEWAGDTPEHIAEQLNEQPKKGWVHWFFRFSDNIALTAEKLDKIRANVPEGTKLYKNKIEGIRCKATGLVFGNFTHARNVRSEAWVREQLKKRTYYEEGKSDPNERGFAWKRFTVGVDTSYSSESEDSIAMLFEGITDTGLLITLDEKVINNKGRSEPLAPSDTVRELIAFLDYNREKWGFGRSVFVDSADQATLTELKKYRRQTGTPYTFENAHKKLKIIDRIIMQRGWIQNGQYIVLEHCREHIGEINCYSYNEQGQPEDRNDHTINACQYGWIPYKSIIGV